MHQVPEGPHPRAHVGERHVREPLHAEGLDRERAERRAVHHGAAQARIREVARGREISHEPAGEGVAGAGGVEHFLERVGGDLERRLGAHEQRAVLALLHDREPRSAREDPAGRPVDVPVARQLARLGVVHHENVDVAQQLEQQVPLRVDPVVHRVAGDELGVLHLVEHAELQLGVDVAEEHVAGVAELGRQLGAELREYAEPRLQRLAAGEVVRVFRLPAERLALRPLDARQVHAARLERPEGAGRIVRPDHAHHLHGVEDHAGGAEEHGGAAGGVRRLTERRRYRVEGDRADHEQTHAHIRSGALIPSR